MSDQISDIVFPPDTRQQVTQTGVYPYSAIGRLVVEFPTAKGSGTGVIIDEFHVLTAAHNLWQNDYGGGIKSAKFIPAETGNSKPFGEFQVVKTWVPEEYKKMSPPDPNDDVKDYKQYLYDFGLVRVSKPFPNATGACGYVPFPNNTITAGNVEIAGYPGDLAKKYGVGTMWTCQDKVTLSDDDNFIFYNIDTFAGQSGAPLLIHYQNSRYICGVHVAGSASLGSNFGVRLNEDNVNTVNGWLNE